MSPLRRLKLRLLLFLLLLLSGIIPLLVGSLLLMERNRGFLETQEKTGLTRSAEALSREVSDDLASTRRELVQLGASLLAAPGPPSAEERLREAWVGPFIQSFLANNPNLLALRVLGTDGAGLRFAPGALPAPAVSALDEAFDEARTSGQRVYRFEVLPPASEPVVVLAAPVSGTANQGQIIVEALVRPTLMEAVLRGEARGTVGVFLIDRTGRLLWSQGASPQMQSAVAKSSVIRDLTRYPLNLTSEYTLTVAGRTQRMLGRVSPVEETGWAMVVHKPAAVAFEVVRRMVLDTLIASAVLILLAAVFAAYAARQVGLPIQRLAETSHEIAAGNFGRRVEVGGLGLEIVGLGEDFNRMSDHLSSYVEQLRRAAQVNRDLFISSIRAFAAAIDAKDPYTRGHSERVAALSRTVGHQLGLNAEQLEKVWIGALLHDVGKIGIDDRILKKGGGLSPEEYQQMKKHPVIGADILAPVEQLREMVPTVRWHHESWNGRGYPDGLRGESIPLSARIVAVTDCFDAITTTRPYHQAYGPDFALQTITQLAGSRFDAKIVTAFLQAVEKGGIAAAVGQPTDEEREAADVRAAAIF